MKRLFSVAISAIVFLSVCIIAVFPTCAEDINWDDWLFDGQGELVGYYGIEADIVIPMEDQNGVPTVSLGGEAFLDNADIESVIIPEGIIKIGSKCFEGCSKLAEVSLPYSLEDCGKYSTFNNTAITSIIVPAKVKTIPSFFVVSKDVQLTDIIITPGVEEIYSKAFYTSGLTELIIPKSVKLMGWGVVRDSSADKDKPLKIYVLNPNAIVGRVADEDGDFAELIGGNRADGGPIADCFGGRSAEIYGVGEETTAKKNVDKHMSAKNGIYISITEEKANELETTLVEKGITEPKATDEPKDTAPDTDEDIANPQQVKNGADTLLIVIISVVIIVILAAAVVLVVLKRKN